MMPWEVFEDLPMSDHAPILEIRREAADLLQKLDEHDMIEAAALMASTIDMIDASIRRLATGEPIFGE
jgi:hypothetical protein